MTIAAKLSRTLYETFGDESAEAMIDWMQGIETHRSELRELNDLAFSRFDARLLEHGDGLRREMHTEIAALRTEVHADIGTLRADIAGLRKEIGDRYGDLLKWSFTFWIGSTVSLVLALLALVALRPIELLRLLLGQRILPASCAATSSGTTAVTSSGTYSISFPVLSCNGCTMTASPSGTVTTTSISGSVSASIALGTWLHGRDNSTSKSSRRQWGVSFA